MRGLHFFSALTFCLNGGLSAMHRRRHGPGRCSGAAPITLRQDWRLSGLSRTVLFAALHMRVQCN